MSYSSVDLSGQDLREVDLTAANVSHSMLNGTQFGVCVGANFVCCKGSPIFVGADISDTTFEKAEPSVLAALVGATWHGVFITRQSGWLTTAGLYGCFATNVFVQIGCMQKTLDAWEAIGQDDETIKALHVDQPSVDLQLTLQWWKANAPTIRACAAQLTQEA